MDSIKIKIIFQIKDPSMFHNIIQIIREVDLIIFNSSHKEINNIMLDNNKIIPLQDLKDSLVTKVIKDKIKEYIKVKIKLKNMVFIKVKIINIKAVIIIKIKAIIIKNNIVKIKIINSNNLKPIKIKM